MERGCGLAALVTFRASPKSVRKNEMGDPPSKVRAYLVGEPEMKARINSRVNYFVDRLAERLPFTRHDYAVPNDRRRHGDAGLVAEDKGCRTKHRAAVGGMSRGIF